MLRKMMVLVALLFASHATMVAAQSTVRGWDPTGLQLTRAELQELLVELEAAATSSSYSAQIRDQARAEALQVRQRLEEGDIRVGDRVVLVVEGHQQLSDTFNVVMGRRVILPELGEVPLTGVLRSELQQHMDGHVNRYIRNAVVHARALVRVEIAGAVGRPGYYLVPSDVPVSDVLMLAGGPVQQARLDRLSIQRAGQLVWAGERMQEAVVSGKTLDQLSIRAGDSIVVPAHGSTMNRVRDILLIMGGITSVITIAFQTGIL